MLDTSDKLEKPLHRHRRYYEQLPEFERERIIATMETGWSFGQIACHLGRSDFTCCRTRRDWTKTEWNKFVFSDESRFNLGGDDNSVRMWGPCGECLNPAFAIHQPTATTTGIWCRVPSYKTRGHS
ncbi:hypothetical protein TNCV_5051171 [Trichonephila clavipes]|nr:hypothetical protein TNCV_5051171 [Trichonephila clavipes]